MSSQKFSLKSDGPETAGRFLFYQKSCFWHTPMWYVLVLVFPHLLFITLLRVKRLIYAGFVVCPTPVSCYLTPPRVSEFVFRVRQTMCLCVNTTWVFLCYPIVMECVSSSSSGPSIFWIWKLFIIVIISCWSLSYISTLLIWSPKSYLTCVSTYTEHLV